MLYGYFHQKIQSLLHYHPQHLYTLYLHNLVAVALVRMEPVAEHILVDHWDSLVEMLVEVESRVGHNQAVVQSLVESQVVVVVDILDYTQAVDHSTVDLDLLFVLEKI